MASTKKMLDKLIILLDDLEKDLFEDNDNVMFYNGVKYTKGEWRNYKAAVKQVQKVYQMGVKKSSKYLKSNAQYNRVLRKISYYKHKKNKVPSDFEKLEVLMKELDEIKIKREEEKLINNKYYLLSDEKNKFIEKYNKSSRDIGEW